jgi:hypothetical protein
MTLDEEFRTQHFNPAIIESSKPEILSWFKSYILSLMEDVKPDGKNHDDYPMKCPCYEDCLSDQEAKIAEELKKRGI